eukprot:1186150-Prorocentrum_minimum.AAC.1
MPQMRNRTSPPRQFLRLDTDAWYPQLLSERESNFPLAEWLDGQPSTHQASGAFFGACKYSWEEN